AGVISNVFYQDLNFSKEQIAEAVKIYGVLFSLVGGFLGGLLAQRMNIMKLMFVGAVLASSTNLIFIGLVKSGKPLDQVELQIGDKHYQVKTDEVGYWKLQVPNQELLNAHSVQVSTQYQNQADSKIKLEVPYLIETTQPQIQLLQISSDDQLTANELKQSLVVKGQLANVSITDLDTERPVVLKLDGQEFVAKVDQSGLFNGVIDGTALQASSTRTITALANLKNNNGNQLLATRQYQINTTAPANSALDIDIQPVAVISPDQQGSVELSGKVIKTYSSLWLYMAIIMDNLASGLAGAAFIAFLSSLTSVSFTAVQYAIFSSLMTLTPKLLGGYSGTIVSNIGYPNFFLMTTLIGIPILILVVWVAKLLRDHENQTTQQAGE
ncbi:MAG: MFS transporter, partial [Pseudomonadota bacterium]|nr:MFS transporter [Pseudomonadota bacterium]